MLAFKKLISKVYIVYSIIFGNAIKIIRDINWQKPRQSIKIDCITIIWLFEIFRHCKVYNSKDWLTKFIKYILIIFIIWWEKRIENTN